MQHLSDPYKQDFLPPGDRSIKTSVNISFEAQKYLERQHAIRGWFQATVSHLVKALIRELKQLESNYDPELYKSRIEHARIIFVGDSTYGDTCPCCGRSTRPNPTTEAPHGDDGRGDTSVAHGLDGHHSIPTQAGGSHAGSLGGQSESEEASGEAVRPKRVQRKRIQPGGGQ